MISINVWTMLSHLVLFLAMLVILNQLMFKPMLRVFDQRKDGVEKNRGEAERSRARADQLSREFAEHMEEAQKEALLELEKVKKAAQDEEDRIIKSARETAGDMVAEIREKIAAQYQSASQSLHADSQAMGREIAGRILGRAV